MCLLPGHETICRWPVKLVSTGQYADQLPAARQRNTGPPADHQGQPVSGTPEPSADYEDLPVSQVDDLVCGAAEHQAGQVAAAP